MKAVEYKPIATAKKLTGKRVYLRGEGVPEMIGFWGEFNRMEDGSVIGTGQGWISESSGQPVSQEPAEWSEIDWNG